MLIARTRDFLALSLCVAVSACSSDEDEKRPPVHVDSSPLLNGTDMGEILLCGDTCDRIKASSGQVTLQFGCSTQVIIPR
jgi:hypothetical protein